MTKATKEKILKEPGGQDKGADLTGCGYHKVYNLRNDLDRKMYTDQTGRFLVRLYRGMQYCLFALMEIFKTKTMSDRPKNTVKRKVLLPEFKWYF